MAKIQFILKARDIPFTDEVEKFDENGKKKYLSSGLKNSATFMANMLRDELGHEVDLVHVIDNNGIDREVTRFRPDIVIIEAFFVVPEKFEILHKLHRKVHWIIRNHSALPFLANEGIAMDWSMRYMDYENVSLCCNDARTNLEMIELVKIYKPEWDDAKIARRVSLLSNYYPASFTPRDPRPDTEYLDVACCGALRPLKNHLIQAVSAIMYADKIGKKLRFHVNGTRIEMKGEPIAHNLVRLFNRFENHELVQHSWLDHPAFCLLLRDMDLAMQVSYTETFNIVTADAVVNDVPVITSSDIPWINEHFYADPNDSKSIMAAMDRALVFEKENPHSEINLDGMKRFNENSKNLWDAYIKLLLS